MSILTTAAQSLTGAVTKAYIAFEDERSTDVTVTGVQARGAGLPPGFARVADVAALANKVTANVPALQVVAGVLHAAESLIDKKHRIEVHFNPSHISFQAHPGRTIKKPNFAADNTVSYTYTTVGPSIKMQVPLLFQDYERTDAFMMEKFSDTTAMARTAAAGIATAVTGNTYSVKPQVEGFLGALYNRRTKKLTFSWGDMSYRGILDSVNAEYTMFNKQGNPIRATVTLTLLLVDEKVADNNMGDWSESYKKAFAKDSSQLGSAVQHAGNLFNVKL